LVCHGQIPAGNELDLFKDVEVGPKNIYMVDKKQPSDMTFQSLTQGAYSLSYTLLVAWKVLRGWEPFGGPGGGLNSRCRCQLVA